MLFHHKTKLDLPKIPKVYMQATISILSMSIYVDHLRRDTVDDSKLCNFIS